MDERARADEPVTAELRLVSDEDVLTAEERNELGALLRERRRGDLAESQRMAESLGVLLASRSESTADDEHDPEGPTLSSEWSRLQALRSDAAHDIVAVDAALERLRMGTYGVCARCGQPIGVDRLRARPTAELCIRCAVAVES
ncbi:RNA polymerase-binding protein DksA [Leifsonia sp. 98AMF]|uniref:TraR/DksA family transcriptional regulator n=1 Tax=unclassified Leifsonia TaxID=2663824 RepID=UPI000376B742|nr:MULTISPECIES: TraR/DksA C4-type zinc finger protein [unclassified Leifsonia]TDP99441.1 TraR/DksA family transcriptional regulator [Leifsonia sp. 115AMFTsu3.1]SDH49660.1 RNA polymerase-binding protein DksA [Leifsonia sp. 197AMF]SDI88304.1 RNA polymerase-binding protein DksA [Leifsonia sp. 466MF]SDJ92908.1 RNA polymerase-binding protein DksA [Leifsonia sp. 157MF]SDN91788.1 RNA polymerase-binding protein DksA [Leifsonia sp. 509MF]